MNQFRFNTMYDREGTGSDRERRKKGTGSDRQRWEAEGRHRQRQAEVGGGRTAQAATGRDGRRKDGTGCDRERWEAKGRHRQRQGVVGGEGKASSHSVPRDWPHGSWEVVRSSFLSL